VADSDAILVLHDGSVAELGPPQELLARAGGVLRGMGPQIQWVHSYVTDDKVYCVYIAPNEAAVREHASQGGSPANRISRVVTSIDPTTADA
jgi:hypothetical protein